MSGKTSDRSTRAAVAAACFAWVVPSLVTWAYFYGAESAAASVQLTVFSVVKTLQFSFPLVWVLWVEGRTIQWRPTTTAGVGQGVLFGLAVTAAAWLLYEFYLQDAAWMAPAELAIQQKVAGWGIDRVSQYALLGVFYALCHSLLEEYYWRWFVYGQLRRAVSVGPALAISSLGFMAHHVLVLGKFFGFDHAATWFFSLAVAVGGLAWAWLYERTGSLLGPWVSHLLVDAVIFWLGYRMVQSSLF